MKLSASLNNFKKNHRRKNSQTIYFAENCKDYTFVENLYKFLLEAPMHMQKTDKQDWKTYQSRIYSILETVIEQGCNDGDFIDLRYNF